MNTSLFYDLMGLSTWLMALPIPKYLQEFLLLLA
jgi:hypothetical protein